MRFRFRIVAHTSAFFLLTFGVASAYAFTSQQIQSFSASAVMGGSSPSTQTLSIQAVPLGAQAYFGKNLVIGVNLFSSDSETIKTTGLAVSLVYQLLDANGQTLRTVTTQPVTLIKDLSNPGHLSGSAVIPRSDLDPIVNNGRVIYYFQALQGTTATVLSHAGAGVFPAPSGTPNVPSGDYFVTSIIDTQDTSVSPAGSVVSLPDTFQFDGHTSVGFPAGAVSASTILTVQQNALGALPAGPGGLAPVVAYTFQLQNGSAPQRPLQVSLSYPAELNGVVTGLNVSPNVLALYRYGPGGWQLTSVPQLDTSLHTVTGITTQLGTFALFPVGAVGATNLRTTQRIITPNGDGKNDVAAFSFVDSSVHIFDIHGRRVRTIPGPSPSWDGRDDDGRIVEVGVYLYQYETQGTRVTGVIAVAK